MKKHEGTLMVSFADINGGTLLNSKMTSVPLREDVILRLSVEFFADPEPCMIHRSAVMSRMYMEMLEYFLRGLDSGKFCHLISELPQRLASFIDLSGCHSVTAHFAAHK